MMDYKELIDRAHRNAVAHGFWENSCDERVLMLIITEIAEAVQADRKDRHADRSAYSAALSYDGEAFRAANFEKYIKGTVEDEIADICIRCFDAIGSGAYDPAELEYLEPELYLYFEEQRQDIENEFCVAALECVDILSQEETTVDQLFSVVVLCTVWAEVLGFDLEWHIREKMRYNESRPYKHNRKY